MAKKYQVCFADEVPAGGRCIVTVAGRSIGIFNVEGKFYAVRNSCPHRGAPLCAGFIDGYVTGERPGQFEFEREGQIIRCPWHGWEFSIQTGESVFNPHKVWVRNYPVSVEGCPSDDKDMSIETYPVSLEATSVNSRSALYVHL
jgi:3-phenylpropionate/trans-cinnamate dioxygenase ferredoxin subunit